MRDVFESLRNRHLQLVARTEDLEKPDEQIPIDIRRFVEELKQAGAAIPDAKDRAQLRTLLRYWSSLLYEWTGSLPDTQILPADPTDVAEALWRQYTPRRLSTTELQQATELYLKHLLSRYRYLEFKGMGVSDRVPLRLPLAELYVPLRARVELPEGETWAREPCLAGRKVSPPDAEALGHRLSEPMALLDLLHQHDGLIVLGDPGAGKTTLLKYLTLQLASGEGLIEGGGTRLPVLLPLSAYANALATRDVPLDLFIAEYYRDRGVDLPLDPILDEALVQGGVFILLDGLDEVHDLARRHLVVQRVVDFFAFHRRAGNKFILTSRIVGYREVRPTTEGLAECTLVDFDEDEITRFVDKWTRAIERAARGDTAVAAQEAIHERAELLAAVHRNPGVRRLAANPLLLTILAVMKRQGVILPERRVELYQKYIETLLKHWNLARGLGRPPTRDLDVVETIRVLAPLALWMHQTNPGAGLVKREDMRRKLVEIYVGRGIDDPERAARRLLADAREHAGLLLERGAGQYGFIHLTFQEYLAAVALALQGQREVGPVVQALAAHLGDDNWHEVSLLAVGYMGIIQQRDEAAGATLWELIQQAPGEPGQATVLAGEAALDAWPGGVTPAHKQQITQALLETVSDDAEVQPRVRAAAGRILARLGDPRPEATMIEAMQFFHIPPGPFLMGSENDPMALSDEEPQHVRDISYGYWMARYPVTAAQFQTFVEGEYQRERYWTEAGWFWLHEDGPTLAPPSPPSEHWKLPDHPAINVSWYEALAFTRWLTERWQRSGQLGEGWLVCLPSESEWEKAARGGTCLPEVPIVGDLRSQHPEPGKENPLPARRFPWGNDPDPNRANYDATGIGITSAVGCFPNGASPYGIEDLSGNVWEWCSTKWQRGYENYRDDNEVEGNDPRSIRGGAFNADEELIRCTFRGWMRPNVRFWNLGFRIAIVPARIQI